MSAHVTTDYTHQAVCADCGWYGDITEHSDEAEFQAARHDQAHHRSES